MTSYMVYYRRNETFHLDKKLKQSDIKNQKTHVLVVLKDGYANKDQVFRDMQGEFMDKRTLSLLKNLILAGETHHTSMSVGDVVRNSNTGTMYQCANAGWVKV
jgi:hypothetical protein